MHWDLSSLIWNEISRPLCAIDFSSNCSHTPTYKHLFLVTDNKYVKKVDHFSKVLKF